MTHVPFDFRTLILTSAYILNMHRFTSMFKCQVSREREREREDERRRVTASLNSMSA